VSILTRVIAIISHENQVNQLGGVSFVFTFHFLFLMSLIMEDVDGYHPWINLLKCMAAVAGTYHAGLKFALYHTNHTFLTSLHVGMSIWLYSYGSKKRLIYAFLVAILSAVATQVVVGNITLSIGKDIGFPCICFIGCLLCGSMQHGQT